MALGKPGAFPIRPPRANLRASNAAGHTEAIEAYWRRMAARDIGPTRCGRRVPGSMPEPQQQPRLSGQRT